MSDPIKLEIINCVACGDDHKIVFKRFREPRDNGYTHWGMCYMGYDPEPVFLRFEETDIGPEWPDCENSGTTDQEHCAWDGCGFCMMAETELWSMDGDTGAGRYGAI